MDSDHTWRRPPPLSRQPILNLPPPVAHLLTALIGIHLLRVVLPSDLDALVIAYFSFIPARYDAALMAALGVEESSVWMKAVPFVSYLFLHADWMHVTLNALWLMVFGTPVARRLGLGVGASVRFYGFYVLCGIAGAATHLVFFPDSATPLIGASAAISGLMGAALRILFGASGLTLRRHGMSALTSPTDSRILIFALVFVLLNMGSNLLGFGGGDAIAWQAHLGGFFTGLFLYGLFDKPQVRAL